MSPVDPKTSPFEVDAIVKTMKYAQPADPCASPVERLKAEVEQCLRGPEPNNGPPPA